MKQRSAQVNHQSRQNVHYRTHTRNCPKRPPPSIPLAVISQYLAGSFLHLLQWWLGAEMPYTPQQMESIFQQLAMPGIWAVIEQKSE